MDMPTAVRTYFDADRDADPERLARAFASDAVVEDEGRRHHGHAAIRAWWLAAQAQYRPTTEAVEVARDGDGVVVRARVSGDFPGSPAVLAFAFTLENDLITTLRIG
ncbi:nuclear transport factor 2 family protein [Oharaeibacter diazotrophicus]|uniref:SnoaL-like protein n=1 Tax=Oharaeibacter diazotrophicus TaxID=1920512 RepID=A0A4R6RIH2_9HYPH|nr:nuclear transport factor 2 family protein [Oharaeibacter diazotrophicus]TDP86172.1 SnoaL-like protein [Oharaeibacter diazotrophicus]BBE71887.1 SnoaL-like domain protein [Pleomorphomonas sp. SM30]GLS78652.1 hypothetical protein GCM10007904_39890 [Oharaeibacter diazotrophicus]